MTDFGRTPTVIRPTAYGEIAVDAVTSLDHVRPAALRTERLLRPLLLSDEPMPRIIVGKHPGEHVRTAHFTNTLVLSLGLVDALDDEALRWLLAREMCRLRTGDEPMHAALMRTVSIVASICILLALSVVATLAVGLSTSLIFAGALPVAVGALLLGALHVRTAWRGEQARAVAFADAAVGDPQAGSRAQAALQEELP